MDGLIKFWNMETKTEINTFEDLENPINDIAFDKNR